MRRALSAQQHTVRTVSFAPSPSPFAARHHPCSLDDPADSTFHPSPRPHDQSNPKLRPDTSTFPSARPPKERIPQAPQTPCAVSQPASPTSTARKHPTYPTRLPPTPARFKTLAPAKTRKQRRQRQHRKISAHPPPRKHKKPSMPPPMPPPLPTSMPPPRAAHRYRTIRTGRVRSTGAVPVPF